MSEERLREYIENDKDYQQFKTVPEETLHEYARLHYIRCRDIENVLNENQQLKEENKELISVLKTIRNDINFVELCDGYLITEILDKVKE